MFPNPKHGAAAAASTCPAIVDVNPKNFSRLYPVNVSLNVINLPAKNDAYLCDFGGVGGGGGGGAGVRTIAYKSLDGKGLECQTPKAEDMPAPTAGRGEDYLGWFWKDANSKRVGLFGVEPWRLMLILGISVVRAKERRKGE